MWDRSTREAAADEELSEAAIPFVCGTERDTEPAVAVDDSAPAPLLDSPNPDEVVLHPEVGGAVEPEVLAGKMDGKELIGEEEIEVAELDGLVDEGGRREVVKEEVIEVVAVDMDEEKCLSPESNSV